MNKMKGIERKWYLSCFLNTTTQILYCSNIYNLITTNSSKNNINK